MNIRLFTSSGTAFVSNQEITVERLPNGMFVIPLPGNQIERNTLRVGEGIVVTDRQVAIVYKGTREYTGVLSSYDGMSVTLLNGATRTIVREYDRIQVQESLVGQAVNGVVPDEITISYVTRGIRGQIIHNLDVSTSILETVLLLQNDTQVDIEDATIEVVTAEEESPMLFRTQAAVFEDAAAPVSTPAGTIYRLPGTHDVPAGFEASIPMFQEEIDGEIIYVIDAPNGTVNAKYTLQWRAPVDLPAGMLYVFRDGSLEATTSINATGAGQERTLTLLNVPSVYARGTVSRVAVAAEGVATTTEIVLDGQITNTLPDTISVYLRYNIGDRAAEVPDDVQVISEGRYLLFPFTLEPNDTMPYRIAFTLLG